MKTKDLLALLAADTTPVDISASDRRFWLALSLGGLSAAILLSAALGIRSDLDALILTPKFWIKLGFPAALAAVGLVATVRLSLPGSRLGAVWVGIVLPLMLVWLVAAAALFSAMPAQREAMVFGGTWRSCSLNIALVSTPVFIGVLWAMKGLAPTRLRLAGASAGLLAGSVGAFVYAFYCPETAAPFLAIWYVLGIAIPAAVGALVGPRVLHW